MFSFLKRTAPPPRPLPHAQAKAHRDLDDDLGWMDSAGQLRSGAEVTEIDGDFAATVFLEHFPEGAG